MKLGSWTIMLLIVNTALTVSLGLYALITVRRELLFAALGFLGFGFVLLLVWRVAASSARCSLCMGPILLNRRCARSRHARRLSGSYRLQVARDIILTNSFRCPYCGESTLCKPRSSTRPGDPTQRDR
jgi:DNA-directed RNA polymerase subunit RPC12/RpoP